MVTNYPHLMTAHERLRTTVSHAHTDGVGARVLSWLRQMFCGLHGHDTLLHYEEERISLRCVSCDYETPGWELNEAAPRVTVRGDARRHALARLQLISARRIA